MIGRKTNAIAIGAALLTTGCPLRVATTGHLVPRIAPLIVIRKLNKPRKKPKKTFPKVPTDDGYLDCRKSADCRAGGWGGSAEQHSVEPAADSAARACQRVDDWGNYHPCD